jgi:hypothetical protein
MRSAEWQKAGSPGAPKGTSAFLARRPERRLGLWPKGRVLSVGLAKAWSRDPADAWIGETFLVCVGVGVAVVVVASALAIGFDGSFNPHGGESFAFVVVAGSLVAGALGCRLVRRRAHQPIARRLYLLVGSAFVIVWALGVTAVVVIAALGNALGPLD